MRTLAFGAIAAAAIALAGGRAAGYSAYVVTSGSMVPALPVGALIAVEATRPAAVRVGDVITYAIADRVVTHRVEAAFIDSGQIAFVTRGDANDADDPWLAVPASDVGEVRIVVPLAGFVVAALQAWWRVLALGVLAWLLADVIVTHARPRESRIAVPRTAHA